MKTVIKRITTEMTDLDALATTLWYSGCKLDCMGCQNFHLKEFTEGFSMEEIKSKLEERRKLTDWIVHTGGNPVDSFDTLIEVAEYAKKLGFKQFLFCGYEQSELNEILSDTQNKRLIELIDYVKVGRYDVKWSKYIFNCADYHFATLNQYVIKANQNRNTWESYYYYKPNSPIMNWSLN